MKRISAVSRRDVDGMSLTHSPIPSHSDKTTFSLRYGHSTRIPSADAEDTSVRLWRTSMGRPLVRVADMRRPRSNKRKIIVRLNKGGMCEQERISLLERGWRCTSIWNSEHNLCLQNVLFVVILVKST